MADPTGVRNPLPLTNKHTMFHQPVAASENDQKECTDQTPTQDADEEVAVAVATDEASDVDAEEKMKLERRRRRCPIVNAVERYLIDEDEGEKKESGNNR